jgi:hypothetical protein
MFPDQFPGTDDYDYLRAQRKRYDPEHEEDEVPFAGLFTPHGPTPTPEDDIDD